MGYRHIPWGVHYTFILVVVGFCISAIFIARMRAINIATFVVMVAEFLSTVILTRKYMSYKRSLTLSALHMLTLAAASNIVAVAVALYLKIFIVWEICLSLGLQCVVFAVTCCLIVRCANKAKPRKVAIQDGGIAAGISITALCLSRLILRFVKPTEFQAGILIMLLVTILAFLFMLCCALSASVVVMMLKYNIDYKPSKQTFSEFCTTLGAVTSRMNNLFGFVYGEYKVYVSTSNRRKIVMTVYRGRKRLQKDVFYGTEDFAQTAYIRGDRLNDIWEHVLLV